MAYEEGRNQEGETTNSDNVIFDFSFSLIKQNSEFSILYKHSVSLSMLLSSLFVIAHCSPFSLHTLQEIIMTCVFKPGKVAAAGRKLFALRFLFLLSPYVISKLSDFYLFVLLIHLLNTIFMCVIIVLVWLLFVQYIPSILTRISKTPQDFWWETRDLVRFSILLVDAVKHAWQANDSTSNSGLEGLVISLKETLPQPKQLVKRIFM